jgi:hypothetical protein
MKSNLLAVFALTATVPAFGTPAPVDQMVTQQWEQMGNDDGIVTWRKEIQGSDVVAFRGRAVINASLAKIASVLSDSSRKVEWVARAIEARDLRKISQLERVEYNRTSPPWPIMDRDFVFHSKVVLDKEKRQMVLDLKSVEDPLAPETSAVRGTIENSHYILTCVDPECTQTDVTVEIHADPKGSLPKWVVNLFQKSWPRKTLEGIRRQVAKPNVAEHAEVKAYFTSATTTATRAN